jgi:hypothetical protein
VLRISAVSARRRDGGHCSAPEGSGRRSLDRPSQKYTPNAPYGNTGPRETAGQASQKMNIPIAAANMMTIVALTNVRASRGLG